MILIVLAAVGFLACAFFLFVLFQWTRDTKRKTTTRTAVRDADGETSKKNHPQIICFKRSDEKHHSFTRRSHRASGMRAVPRVGEGREFNETGKEKQGE